MRNLNSFILVLFSSLVFSQNTEVDSLSLLLEKAKTSYDIANANLQLAKYYERSDISKSKEFAQQSLKYKSCDSLQAMGYNQLGRVAFFEAKLDSAIYYLEKTKHFFLSINNYRNVAKVNISIGAAQLKQAEYNKTIKTLTESATFFEKDNDPINAAKCYNNIGSAFAELNNYPKAIEYSNKALTVFSEQNQEKFQLITLSNLAFQYFKNGDTIRAVKYNLLAEKEGILLDNKRTLSIVYNNLGSIYLDKNPIKAKKYLQKTLRLKEELKLKDGLEIVQINLGYLLLKNKEYTPAIAYYKKAAQKVNGKQLIVVYSRLKDCYKGLNQLDTALSYAEKITILSDSVLTIENQKHFTEIQTKYETKQKEREITALKTKNIKIDSQRKQNRNLLFTALGILVITLLLVSFILKNRNKRRLVAQQKHTIKTHKLEKQLKDQELEGIDAIIDAQEKERKKIANDLHDNLGSKVATLKLYIEEITDNDNQRDKNQLLKKLKNLTDATYKEIRSIAHQKKFGTFINKGLIPSIQAIANQITDSHKLEIEVININVTKHIANTTEIQIFRIVQELLTNCIKHANATEVIIQFSEYENMLNITVEDNGKGFDINKIPLGFGLKNSKKRIEKIGGTLDIDATLGIGSTFSISIPL